MQGFHLLSCLGWRGPTSFHVLCFGDWRLERCGKTKHIFHGTGQQEDPFQRLIQIGPRLDSAEATARAAGLEVIFEPSVANAESLAAELRCRLRCKAMQLSGLQGPPKRQTGETFLEASELPDFGHKLLCHCLWSVCRFSDVFRCFQMFSDPGSGSFCLRSGGLKGQCKLGAERPVFGNSHSVMCRCKLM